MDKQAKKRIFSGVQPSGNLHIGNYLGAISQWVPMQNEYDCIFCVVDYHAITVKQDPEELKRKIIEIAKIYLAFGIDPKKSIIFQQSQLSAHTELAWILNTVTRMSDLFRMTQFKDKTKTPDLDKIIEEIEKRILNNTETQIVSSKVNEQIQELSSALGNLRKSGVGLFDYPVLMVSDILLYNTDAVPVGKDQSQHVELTRTLARRFNDQFGNTLKVPELIIRKEGAMIMGLDDPTKKMSKSAPSEFNYIGLTDDPEKAVKKIMRAVTDSGSEIKYNPEEKPAISNLLVIYSLLANKKISDLEKKYVGSGYGEFKKDLAEVVKHFLVQFQDKFYDISDKDVRKILDKGAKDAGKIAEKTLKKVKEKIGIL